MFSGKPYPVNIYKVSPAALHPDLFLIIAGFRLKISPEKYRIIVEGMRIRTMYDFHETMVGRPVRRRSKTRRRNNDGLGGN